MKLIKTNDKLIHASDNSPYFSDILITCESSAGEGHEFCIATRGQDPCPHLIHATIPCSNKTINDPLQRCSNLNCISLARN